MARLSASKSPSPRHSSRRAFTFLEILFSVIIIGVGFIMIAAIFPVAINQQQANVSEAAATSVGREAIRMLQSSLDSVQPQVQTLASGATITYPMLPCTYPPAGPNSLAPANTLPIMPLPNELVTVSGANTLTFAQNSIYAPPTYAQATTAPGVYMANPAIMQILGNQLPTNDRRFSWTAFYRRDTMTVNMNGANQLVPAPYAQVWIFVAQSTAEGQTTFAAPPAVGPGNFCPACFLKYSPAGSTASFVLAKQTTPFPAAPNAFVLILNSPPATAGGDPNLIGQVLRLGNPVPPTQASLLLLPNGFPDYYLAPGADLNKNDPNLAAGALIQTTAFVLGSPFNALSGQYLGSPQDIAVVSGFIRINN